MELYQDKKYAAGKECFHDITIFNPSYTISIQIHGIFQAEGSECRIEGRRQEYHIGYYFTHLLIKDARALIQFESISHLYAFLAVFVASP